ncbi:MAG: hypothetical protein K2V38_25375, partial [Gemmataceae bacterium]|nr:hypothetical protein [Gemmataceae bacterium]
SDRRHIEILATGPAAAGLQELDLSGNALIEDDGWAVLANAPGLAGLQALRLDGCRLGVSGVAALANSPHLTGLRRLSLAGHDRDPLGAEAVRALCGGRGLNQLRELNLKGQHAGVDGFRALAGWPGLARLTRLDVSSSDAEQDEPGWMSAAWGALARSPHWGELRELYLDGESIDALAALLASPNVATLRLLGFDHAFWEDGPEDDGGSLQDEAAALLAGCPHLSDELVLQLPAEGLTPDGLRRLRDRFGDRVLAIPDVYGANRQPGDWSSGRPSRCAFYTEEPDPGRPPTHT